MRLLRRYIWRAVMIPVLLIIAILMLLDGLFSFVFELESLRNEYQILQALQFVVTTLPRRLAEFLPMAILLGALAGLGLLANSGELTVMRAAGVSTGRITWMVLRPTILLLLIGLFVAEYISPHTEQIARSNRSLAETGGVALGGQSGLWHREGNEFIHISAVEPNGVLHGVTRYRLDETHQLVETRFISRAIYQGNKWSLEGVRGSRLFDDHIEAWAEDSGQWDIQLTPDVLSVIVLQPEHLAVSKIYEYARYLQQQGIHAGEYMLVFWQKLAQPLGVLGMVMIAVSFIFGPLRQVSMGLRMTAGILAGLVFHYGQQFFGHMSLVFDASPMWAALAPAIICLVAGVVLLRRVR
ncbi:LPS export ABC transporter permease LptG [Alcanivorax sp. 1008]|uniref:LPS export ABC transporter permease LptG n=1 Tax=Alcanivorax sp. 1008 TaxID=2816853 RepID=UPI001E009C77|nr:LPS export ABC transporter permease LptG [Alcanivorax sp. 1008]MCC1495198.1 LPS export ABC transporter permease LptG [Alcanivorax sp. 1008]